jgi:hypothetical protein
MQMIPPQPVSSVSLISSHRVLKIIIAALILMAIGGAVIWEVLRVTAPPALTVSSPADNLLTDQTSVTLEGRAEIESTVTVNGSPISVAVDGAFKEELDLRTGLNIITISASKKFAMPNVIYRRVVVTKKEPTSVSTP